MCKDTSEVKNAAKQTPTVVYKEDIREAANRGIRTSALLSYSLRDYAYSTALICSKLYELESKGELDRVVIRMLDTFFAEYEEEAMNHEYPEGSIPEEGMAFRHFCNEVLDKFMTEFYGDVQVSTENYERALRERKLDPANYSVEKSGNKINLTKGEHYNG